MFPLGTQEMVVLLVIGVLLFGRRLPEIGRYLGKGIVEFKKGLSGVEEEIEAAGPTQRLAAPMPAGADQTMAATR